MAGRSGLPILERYRVFEASQTVGGRRRQREVLAEALGDLYGGERGRALLSGINAAWTQPNEIDALLAATTGDPRAAPWVLGPVGRRVFVFPTGQERARFVSLGGPLGRVHWPDAFDLRFDDPASHDSEGVLSWATRHRMRRPLVQLVALYHPEVFPLPRFALGISDLARSIRRQMMGRVRLTDMQLGIQLDEILAMIDAERPDIVGISATFGQQDIMDRLLDALASKIDYSPLTVIGGSLGALNAVPLLERHARLIVCKGPGEATMQDLVRYWHGDIGLAEVTDIVHRDHDGPVQRTHRLNNRAYDDVLPELDVLPLTLDSNGAMQLESSRGCTYACSFCPREHKGIWNGDLPGSLTEVLPEIAEAFDTRPHVSRRIFLVDEEFVGYQKNEVALTRASGVCDQLKEYGFRFETSSRIDQVYRRGCDRTWHVERIRFWKYLAANGLDRCLFGVESGVDSILERFNKKTSSSQNTYAIRILSSCNIPIRCTYITFDPLMTLEELIATYRYQGRRDLLLRPRLDLEEGVLFDGVHDQAFVEANASGRPFYDQITYMLVSMECLIGSPYLRLVEEAGLAREHHWSMGRRNAVYVDPGIGLISHHAQCWIDRNFSLDYALKSIEKISTPAARVGVRQMRSAIKRRSYDVLGCLLSFRTADASLLSPDTGSRMRALVSALAAEWNPDPAAMAANAAPAVAVLEGAFSELVGEIESLFESVRSEFRSIDTEVIGREIARWRHRREWGLINDF